MSSVMIRCPITGRPVSTAIEIEPSVFRKLPKVAARMLCPACGQEHVVERSVPPGLRASRGWSSGAAATIEAA